MVIKVSQTVHKYIEVEAEDVFDAIVEARQECSPYISEPDDYDDFIFSHVEEK